MQKAKRDQKIDAILSSTIELLAEKGYADTSIADIASHAKVYKSPAISIFLSLSHILWLLPMSGLWIS